MMDVRVLNDLVEEQLTAMERDVDSWSTESHASLLGFGKVGVGKKVTNVRKLAQRVLELGDICMGAQCPMLAIKVWREAALRLEELDYNWVYESINPSYVRFDNLVSAKEAITLGRRIDKAWHLMGHPEMAVWARKMKRAYEDMWLDKYYKALP